MLPLIKLIFAATLLLALASCNSHYPEGMSRAERKKYYDDYNKAYTEKNPAPAPITEARIQRDTVVNGMQEINTSIPFSIWNNSLLPQKVEIDGNILDFSPFEVRYVGFASGTKVYWYDKKAQLARGKFLFEVKEKDRDKRFTLFN